MSLAEQVYALTKTLPQSELYGLTSQMRRAAVSVAANIAEGHGRESSGSFVQSLRIAQGSLKELETHLILAQRLQMASSEDVDPLLAVCAESGRMLRALLRAIQAKIARDD
jgi:four helix bundle protein